MDRKKKLGLTVLSLVLWAQLIFSIGITAWRFLLINRGEAELFLSVTAQQVEPLVSEVQQRCPSQETLLFLGQEANYYYARYQLFPRRLSWLRVNEARSADLQHIAGLVMNRTATVEGDVCLLADQVPDRLPLNATIMALNDKQILYIFRN